MAVIDLTGMVSGKVVREAETRNFVRALDALQKKKGRDQLKVSGGMAPPAKSAASPIEQLEPENNVRADKVPSSEEESLDRLPWDGGRPLASQL